MGRVKLFLWKSTQRSVSDVTSDVTCFSVPVSVFLGDNSSRKSLFNAEQNMMSIFPAAGLRQRSSCFSFPFSQVVTSFLFFFWSPQATTMSKSDDLSGRSFLLLFILRVCTYSFDPALKIVMRRHFSS